MSGGKEYRAFVRAERRRVCVCDDDAAGGGVAHACGEAILREQRLVQAPLKHRRGTKLAGGAAQYRLFFGLGCRGASASALAASLLAGGQDSPRAGRKAVDPIAGFERLPRFTIGSERGPVTFGLVGFVGDRSLDDGDEGVERIVGRTMEALKKIVLRFRKRGRD
jgi:hypothetical protein